jgi:hypothetical protein
VTRAGLLAGCAAEPRARLVRPAAAERGLHLAREPHHAHAVRAVERDLHLEHRVGLGQVAVERLADDELDALHERAQVEDAVVVLGELQLAAGAEHPLALLAPDLRRLDDQARSASSCPPVASGTIMPAVTFGAPHTTFSSLPPPSTRHRLNLSAFGCFTASSTRAITTPG